MTAYIVRCNYLVERPIYSYLYAMKIITRYLPPLLLIMLTVGQSLEAKRYERTHFDLEASGYVDVDQVESVVNRTRQSLMEFLRDSLTYRPVIHIAFSDQEFDSLIGGYFPDWGAAAAIPSRRQMVFKSPDVFNLRRDFAEMLAHEYAHLVLAERVAYRPVPRWLNEGLAMYVSTEWSWSDNLTMSKAAVFGQYVPLDEVELVNRFSESRAHLAYAQSFLTVNYLFDAYSINALNILLDRLEAGDSIDSALRQSTGSNLKEFQAEVWATYEPRFNLLSLFMDTIYFWVALAIVVVVGGILNFRKRRKQYQRWEEDEQLHSTDFDYGDPDNPEQIDDEDEPWRN